MFADDEANDLILPNATGSAGAAVNIHQRSSPPGLLGARVLFRPVGWTLIVDHNVAAERCSGFITLAALANLLKVITLWLALNAAKASGRLTPWTFFLQCDSRGISVLCPQPAICPLLKSRQHRHRTEIFIGAQYGLFLLKAT